jgi:hypothetical protein
MAAWSGTSCPSAMMLSGWLDQEGSGAVRAESSLAQQSPRAPADQPRRAARSMPAKSCLHVCSKGYRKPRNGCNIPVIQRVDFGLAGVVPQGDSQRIFELLPPRWSLRSPSRAPRRSRGAPKVTSWSGRLRTSCSTPMRSSKSSQISASSCASPPPGPIACAVS